MDPLNLKEKFDGLEIKETSVLDLGCGTYGSPISSQMKALPFKRLISIDAHKPSINQLHRSVDSSHFAAKAHVCRNRDAVSHVNAAMPDAYDVVTIFDLIEHLGKDASIALLKQCKKIVRSRILLWVPLGECPQGDIAGNPFQKHLSTWSAADLKKLGFEVEVFKKFHTQFDPPVDAAWAIWEKNKPAKKTTPRKKEITKEKSAKAETKDIEEKKVDESESVEEPTADTKEGEEDSS